MKTNFIYLNRSLKPLVLAVGLAVSPFVSYAQEQNSQSLTNDKLNAAKEELNNLRSKYTDGHPMVIAQQKNIEVLERAVQNRSQGSERAASSRYNLEISNGMLSLDKNRIDVKATFGRDIPGIVATLGNVVTLLRELHPGANIVMEPSLANLKIADLKMRSTNGDDDAQLRDELLALAVASGNKFHWDQPAGGSPQIDPLTGQPVKHQDSSSSLYILSVDAVAAANKPRRQVEVFNLSTYIHGLDKKEDLNENLARIRAIIDLTVAERVQADGDPDSIAPTFDFHAGANLLIVTGSPDSLEVASKVINALLSQPQESQGSAAVNPFRMDPQMMERYFGVKIPQGAAGPNSGPGTGGRKPLINNGSVKETNAPARVPTARP